jgi:hypothetical protein
MFAGTMARRTSGRKILGQIVEAQATPTRRGNFEKEAHYPFRDGPLTFRSILCALRISAEVVCQNPQREGPLVLSNEFGQGRIRCAETRWFGISFGEFVGGR